MDEFSWGTGACQPSGCREDARLAALCLIILFDISCPVGRYLCRPIDPYQIVEMICSRLVK
ncbi:unnamed protein product [Nippostrongylus brasiliensis]|uniref:Uncharacterized protein n=1 Tax=Nippostrongylus brasiliensis TaxID=27835 RepID=A0A0N4XRE8_NIPBR|nr:unnamed protein product [Nippostrongylus brasiliensis]